MAKCLETKSYTCKEPMGQKKKFQWKLENDWKWKNNWNMVYQKSQSTEKNLCLKEIL